MKSPGETCGKTSEEGPNGLVRSNAYLGPYFDVSILGGSVDTENPTIVGMFPLAVS